VLSVEGAADRLFARGASAAAAALAGSQPWRCRGALAGQLAWRHTTGVPRVKIAQESRLAARLPGWR